MNWSFAESGQSEGYSTCVWQLNPDPSQSIFSQSGGSAAFQFGALKLFSATRKPAPLLWETLIARYSGHRVKPLLVTAHTSYRRLKVEAPACADRIDLRALQVSAYRGPLPCLFRQM